jgi:hypothetical protein
VYPHEIHICYKYIIAEDRIDIINYVISNHTKNTYELDSICIAAISKNKISVLKLLADHNYNFDKEIPKYTIYWSWSMCSDIITDNYKFIHTPLSYSCTLSNLEIVEFLINLGVDINHENGLAFRYACVINNVEIINCFLQSNLSQNTLVNGLITACIYVNMTIINLIMDHVCDIGPYFNIIFCELAHKGTPEVIQYLMIRGFVLNSNEPLKIACMSCNMPLVKFYLEYGLKVDNEIILIVLEKFNIQLVKMFLDHNVDFSQLDNSINEYDEVLGTLEQNGLNMSLFAKYLVSGKYC